MIHRPGRRLVLDNGTVTAETAVVLPSLLLVLGACVWVLSVLSAQMRCVDAAHEAARAAARGESVAAVRAAAVSAAPAGAAVTVRAGLTQVTVEVAATVHPFGGLRRLVPGVRVAASARATTEAGSGAIP